MTLHVYSDMLQRSEEWYATRCGIVTASVVGQLITSKTIKPASNDNARALYYKLLAERITGRVEETYQSPAMWRGTVDEPIARDLYSARYGQVTECGFMARTYGSRTVGYSPDGLVGKDGLIEIKSRDPKEQVRTILADQVPIEFMPQIQCGLMVSGRAWLDFVSFSGGLPLYVKRVRLLPEWETAVEDAVVAFEKWAQTALAEWTRMTRDLTPTERVDYESAYNVELHL